MSAPEKRPMPNDPNLIEKNPTAVALADSLKALAETAMELHSMRENALSLRNYELAGYLRETMPMTMDAACAVDRLAELVVEAYGG